MNEQTSSTRGQLCSFGLRSATCLLIAMFLFVGAQGQEILTSIDKRSLKGKIDSRNTEAVLIELLQDEGYRYEGKPIGRDDLSQKLDALMDTRSPEHRRITVAAHPTAQFHRIAELMLIGRALDIDDFTLVVPANGTGAGQTSGVGVKIVLEEPGKERPAPWPLTLIVERDSKGALLLNGKPQAEGALAASLRQIFETRRKRRIYIEGSRSVEKTVFVRSAKSAIYDDLMKVLLIVNSSGARPIAVEIDWLQ